MDTAADSRTKMDENLSKMVAHHDWWAATYDSDVQTMALYNRVTWNNLQRFLPADRNSVILDAGGGTGFWALQLAQLGYRVVLTDISTGMLEKAREKVVGLALEDRVETRVSDIRNMPEFEDGQFGMVVCQGDPLSYCGDYQAALRELARVVCKGGAVVASVDNRVAAMNWLRTTDDIALIANLLEKGDVVAPQDNEDFRYVVHAFTPTELTMLFDSNDLSVERIIGKLVIARRLELYQSDDPDIQEWLYQRELRYCDDPAYLPLAGHLEIVGRKR